MPRGCTAFSNVRCSRGLLIGERRSSTEPSYVSKRSAKPSMLTSWSSLSVTKFIWTASSSGCLPCYCGSRTCGTARTEDNPFGKNRRESKTGRLPPSAPWVRIPSSPPKLLTSQRFHDDAPSCPLVSLSKTIREAPTPGLAFGYVTLQTFGCFPWSSIDLEEARGRSEERRVGKECRYGWGGGGGM